MCRNARQSSSQMTSHSNSSSYNLTSHQPPKCIMVDPHPNLGYICGAKIFLNVEAMQAKETMVREKK